MHILQDILTSLDRLDGLDAVATKTNVKVHSRASDSELSIDVWVDEGREEMQRTELYISNID